jgi:hypothetical protein
MFRRKSVAYPTKQARRALMKQGERVHDIDRSQWIRPVRISPPITMPTTAYREITDEMLGMPRNDGAQLRAEGFLACVIADRLRRENQARAAATLAAWARLAPGPTVHAEVDDASITVIDPTDVLDETDKAILAELKRITARPPCRWMRVETDLKAG